jgi:glycosyltransferase involved in cell wall biosynthesis
LIHPRQYLFVDELRRQGVEALEIYPSRWGNNSREGGFSINREDFEKYTFKDSALPTIKNFEPDLMLTYAEWWQYQAIRSTRWAEFSINVPHVLFVWENLKKPKLEHKRLLNKQALVICGSKKAEEIVKPYCNTFVLPQVGVRSDIFTIDGREREKLVLFVGREVREKGIEFVDKLERDGYSVARAKGISYRDMPSFYNKGCVLIVPSLTTPDWMEQYAPFASIEAMLCGTPVVAFKSGAIEEWISSSPSKLVREGDYLELKKWVDYYLNKWNLDLAEKCREWALFLNHENIAREYIYVLREVKHRQRF